MCPGENCTLWRSYSRLAYALGWNSPYIHLPLLYAFQSIGASFFSMPQHKDSPCHRVAFLSPYEIVIRVARCIRKTRAHVCVHMHTPSLGYGCGSDFSSILFGFIAVPSFALNMLTRDKGNQAAYFRPFSSARSRTHADDK